MKIAMISGPKLMDILVSKLSMDFFEKEKGFSIDKFIPISDLEELESVFHRLHEDGANTLYFALTGDYCMSHFVIEKIKFFNQLIEKYREIGKLSFLFLLPETYALPYVFELVNNLRNPKLTCKLLSTDLLAADANHYAPMFISHLIAPAASTHFDNYIVSWLVNESQSFREEVNVMISHCDEQLRPVYTTLMKARKLTFSALSSILSFYVTGNGNFMEAMRTVTHDGRIEVVFQTCDFLSSELSAQTLGKILSSYNHLDKVKQF